MGEYKQQGRKMRVTVDGLGPDDLLLKAFCGTETISRLFTYEVEMIAENKQKIAYDQVLGKKATIHLQLPDESSETHLNGLVVAFSQGDRDDTFTTYRAELVPEAWRLTRKTQSKIFQRKNVPDILKATLKGFPVDWKLEGTYEPRDYCAQYRESDFDFASRLMEEEGIWYYFSHSDGSHVMVVGDKPGGFVDVKGETSFVYEELEGGTRDDNRVWAWEKVQRMRAGKVLLWDHCFELPHRHLDAEAPTIGSVSAGKDTHKLTVPGVPEMEMYDWPGAYAQRFDGINKSGGEQPGELQKIFVDNRRTVEIRMDAETAPAVQVKGKSNVKHLVPGHKFSLKRHFAGGDGQYLLVSVQHSCEFAGDYRSGKDPLTYSNSFTCMPVALVFRPARETPKPYVRGTQTAVVVGPPGEEIFTDKYGRIKVQFHWDRDGKKDIDSSCWVRVGQIAAGRRWGGSFWPRIGQEVIVDFLEGDPDQPIVVGSVYNADQMPPYLGNGLDPKHKNDHNVMGVKSNTTPGGAGFNEWRFDDTKDKEQVFIHAERNMDVRVKSDSMETVGGSKHLTVGGEKDGKKFGDFEQLVYKDYDLYTRGRHEHLVGGDMHLTVGGEREGEPGDLVVVVKGRRYGHVEGKEFVQVDGFRAEKVGGDQHLTVGGDQLEKVGMRHALEAGTEIHLKAGTTFVIEAAARLSLKVGGNFIDISPAGISIQGTMVLINSGGAPASGSGSSPLSPGKAKEAKPVDPVAADDSKTGFKSCS